MGTLSIFLILSYVAAGCLNHRRRKCAIKIGWSIGVGTPKCVKYDAILWYAVRMGCILFILTRKVAERINK